MGATLLRDTATQCYACLVALSTDAGQQGGAASLQRAWWHRGGLEEGGGAEATRRAPVGGVLGRKNYTGLLSKTTLRHAS